LISLRPHGWRLLIVSLALTTFAIAVNDALILATALALLAPLITALVHAAYLHTTNPCRCTKGCNQTLELIAGESVEHRLELSCRPARVQAPEWVQPRMLDGGRLSIRARFHTFGLHKLEKLDVVRYSFLGLVELHEPVECGLAFRVYPRTIYWLERVLELLEERGGGGGEGAGRGFIASSGEYLESREYTPGLPWRIDWRAYARTGKLVVKVFEWPLGGEEALNIFYEIDCLGPTTCDAVASSLLSLIVLAAEQNRATSIRLCKLEDGKCLEYSVEEAAKAVISILFRARVLQKLVEVYEYVNPLEARRAQQLLSRVKRLGNPRQATPASTPGASAVIVSTLVTSPSKLVETVENLRVNGVSTTVVGPEKPWMDVENPEKRYAVHKTFLATVRSLEALGAYIVLV